MHPSHRNYLHQNDSTSATPTGRYCISYSLTEGLDLPLERESEIWKIPRVF